MYSSLFIIYGLWVMLFSLCLLYELWLILYGLALDIFMAYGLLSMAYVITLYTAKIMW